MKEVTSATFRDTFTEETEVVQVRRYNTVLGIWYPEGTMDKTDKPATREIGETLEKQAPKAKRGRVSTGLGEIPGARDPYKEFRPAPKPGK